VASYANPVGANGTVEHPWLTEVAAEQDLVKQLPTPQQQEGNIIYVHANSVFNGAIIDFTNVPDNVITPVAGVRILGEGTYVVNGSVVNAEHFINVPVVGQISLPRVDNFVNRPIYENQVVNAFNPTGSGLDLTGFSGPSVQAPTEVSGIQFGDPTALSSGPKGYGFFANGVQNVVFSQNDVNFAQLGGIALNGTTGSVLMQGTVINNVNTLGVSDPIATAPALDIENSTGTSDIVIGVDPFTHRISEIINQGGPLPGGTALVGPALVIQKQATGSLVDLTGLTINDGVAASVATLTPGGGVYINQIDGIVILGTMNLNDTTPTTADTLNGGTITTNGSAIEILGTLPPTTPTGFGNIYTDGPITIISPQGNGIYVHNTPAETVGTQVAPSSVNFGADQFTINSAATITIENADAGGLGVGGAANGSTASGGAIVIVNNAGNTIFDAPVTITNTGVTLANAPAPKLLPIAAIVDQQNTGSLFFLSPLSITGSTLANAPVYNGIQIGGWANLGLEANTGTGQFNAEGTTTITDISGYSIQVGDKTFVMPAAVLNPPFQLASNPTSAANPLIPINANFQPVSFNGVTIVNRDNEGIVVAGVEAPVNFFGTTSVANQNFNALVNPSLSTAVDIENNLVENTAAGVARVAGDVTFVTLTISDAVSPANPTPLDQGAGLNVVDNQSAVQVSNITITDAPVGDTTAALYANNDGLVNRIADPANPGAFIPLISSVTTSPQLGLKIDGGTITAVNAAAVHIFDSVMGVTLTSVNSSKSNAFGINLRNNVGIGSQVSTTAGTTHPNIFTANGGSVITATDNGVYLLNTEGVVLNKMTISNNGTGGVFSGVYAQTPNLTMTSDLLQGNTGFGINVNAVAVPITPGDLTISSTNPAFTLDSSTVANNLGSMEVAFTAATLGTYNVIINGDSITHTIVAAPGIPGAGEGGGFAAPLAIGQDAVLVQSLTAAAGSVLNLSVINSATPVGSGFTINQGAGAANAGLPGAAFEVDWNGNVKTGNFISNDFTFTAIDTNGLVLNLNGGPSTFVIGGTTQQQGNLFTSDVGFGTTGINIFEQGGPITVSILTNTMNWVAGPAVGVGANVGVGQDTGIWFQSVTSGSQIAIQSNTINYDVNAAAGAAVGTFTGIEIDNVSSINTNRATINIENNLLTENGIGIIGIEIPSVVVGVLNLTGAGQPFGLNTITLNGLANGAANPYFIGPQVGTTFGQIDVNGVFVP